jgi:tripartite-type tricarboxylate transporter receptor subunit TctC
VQENYANPGEPTDTMTFRGRGVTDFSVQAWNGTAWTTLATVTGNNLVKRTVTFAPYATDRVRIVITRALAWTSQLAEGFERSSHVVRMDCFGVAGQQPGYHSADAPRTPKGTTPLAKESVEAKEQTMPAVGARLNVRIAVSTALMVVAIATTGLVRAQETYPNRPVKIIAPQAPGGGVDLVARIIADRLRVAMGQPFVIENQAGAGGAMATQTTARAQPDGYTLMIGYVATHATNPAVKHNLGYDAIKDFTPIAMLDGTPNVLVVNRNVPVNTLQEFVAYAKAHPREVDYGTSGVGTLNHLVMEQFKHASGVPSMAVPYRSIGQAFTDAMGGQIAVIFPGLAAALPHLRKGTFKALAVTGEKRQSALPDVPTFKESGYEGFKGLTWYGIVGPARLPDAVTRKLNEEINNVLAAPDLREIFSKEALDVMPMTPAQFGQYIADEIEHWTAVARASNIHAD